MHKLLLFALWPTQVLLSSTFVPIARTTTAPPTVACPTFGVNTGDWAPGSTSCGYASRVRNTLNGVSVTFSAYGSYNPYNVCNVSYIQSSSYESRSIRCPCVGTTIRYVNGSASLCGDISTCASGSFCDAEPSEAYGVVCAICPTDSSTQ